MLSGGGSKKTGWVVSPPLRKHQQKTKRMPREQKCVNINFVFLGNSCVVLSYVVVCD